ncbi:uncharacterized protein EDB93DRAFT_1246354 [Suillus bovinus]|uniref:uncharacterized protein n=1 Tax=Suillus bovinus TaxID=48563 RepID=UPI001B87C841|nr:uncharacterized protein EDB93DRAFT_1246354 [Suillus bovinus]KAG2158514.1 hypothetical protein EDB93DRAFT_1246354 [Suillus bovinus]
MPPSDDVIDPTLLEDRTTQHHGHSFAQLAIPQVHKEPNACTTPRERGLVAQNSRRGITRLGCNVWPGEYGQPMSSPLESLSRRLVNAEGEHAGASVESGGRELMEYGHPESPAMLNYPVPLPLSSVGMKCAGHLALATTEGLQFVKKFILRSATTSQFWPTRPFILIIYKHMTGLVKLEWPLAALKGNLKIVLRPLVETEFGLSNKKTPEAMKSNAALAATLIGNCKLLTCKNRKAGKGLFEANIILKGMIKWCYNRKNSMGVTLASYFKDPTTGRASLDIMAAIEACVAEWTTGMRIKMCFYKECPAAVFKIYHKMLIDFDEGMKHTDILPKICKRLLRHACLHANVLEDPIGVGGTSDNFSTEEFAAAVAEWDRCVELDDEY